MAPTGKYGGPERVVLRTTTEVYEIYQVLTPERTE